MLACNTFEANKQTMKKIYIIMLLIVSGTLISFGCKNDDKKDSNDDIKTFLCEMTDARMMDIEEGKVAAERGTIKEVKDYGNLMIKDQNYLLDELKKFAKTKNITLPTKISDEKLNGLKDLKEKSGKDLDKKFLKMISIDHKRDVRKFKKATEIDDQETKVFAKKHLPMIKSHLKKVCQIRKDY